MTFAENTKQNPVLSNSIIFSADDFGKSKKANRNILALLEKGLLDRVSIMVNREITDQEIKKLVQSKIKLDLHLETTSSKLENTGVWLRSSLFMLNLLSRKTSPQKIEEFWEKQIKKFQKMFGRSPDGLNSHEHIHFFPPYFKITLKLCKNYKISFVRFGKKGILMVGGSKIAKILNFLHKIDKKYFLKSIEANALQIQTTDYLISLDWTKNFNQFLRGLPKGTVEVVCHPEKEHGIISNIQK